MKAEPTQENFLPDQEKSTLLNHIRNLGAHKCLGYLLIDEMEKTLNISAGEEVLLAKKNGFMPVLLNAQEVGMKQGRGALFVYEPNVLSQILGENRDILKKYDWPGDNEGFVRRAAKERVFKDREDLLHVIERAFGDVATS